MSLFCMIFVPASRVMWSDVLCFFLTVCPSVRPCVSNSFNSNRRNFIEYMYSTNALWDRDERFRFRDKKCPVLCIYVLYIYIYILYMFLVNMFWCFVVAGPSTWNSLPGSFRDQRLIGKKFRCQFKMYFFRNSDTNTYRTH